MIITHDRLEARCRTSLVLECSGVMGWVVCLEVMFRSAMPLLKRGAVAVGQCISPMTSCPEVDAGKDFMSCLLTATTGV